MDEVFFDQVQAKKPSRKGAGKALCVLIKTLVYDKDVSDAVKECGGK